MFDYLPQRAIVVDTYEAAAQIMKILIENNYVVMLSREEHLWCINWIYSPLSDRNDVVFVDRETFEEEEYKNSKLREE